MEYTNIIRMKDIMILKKVRKKKTVKTSNIYNYTSKSGLKIVLY